MSCHLATLVIVKKKRALSDKQREIMSKFYKVPFTKVLYSKRERGLIWTPFKTNRSMDANGIHDDCPALQMEMQKASNTGNNLQSAVFSECVYAQTLANMFKLTKFCAAQNSANCLTASASAFISDISNFVPRYVYASPDEKEFLVQAGGNGNVDCIYINMKTKRRYLIEFKERAAKSSEPDLPKYGEDGYLIKTKAFILKNPQFESMVDEQLAKRLNFFDRAGTNIHSFSNESVYKAINQNYAGEKFADVICVEDAEGYLTMIPADQIADWADIKGEIRPAGRNKYKVWTPIALEKTILEAGGKISDGQVVFPLNKLNTASARGGDGTINRYKINSLFFVYARDVTIKNADVKFSLSDVKQLNPTISAHMFFNDLYITDVDDAYETE